jgi:hypothetical protein
MTDTTDPLINKTGRAVITIGVLVFAIGIIVYALLAGDPDNSLHQSAMSWSYTLVIFTMLGLGIDSAAATFINSRAPAPPTDQPK